MKRSAQSLNMVSLAAALAGQIGLYDNAVAAPMSAPAAAETADQADLPLQTDILEPFVRQLCVGAITVLYKGNLDKDPELETVVPGVHAAMVEAALAAANTAIESELTNAKNAGRQALHSALTLHELARLAYVYRPYIEGNRGKIVVIHPGETASAAVDRWTASLTEDPGYRARVRQVAAEPGMERAVNVATPIVAEYNRRVRALGMTAVQTGIAAAKAKANAMATAKGLASPYPGA